MISSAPPSRIGISIPPALWEAIARRYEQSGRFYHCVKHIQEVLAHFDEVSRTATGWQHPREVFLALLFHDVVYVPGGHDNEEQSAALAAESIQRWFSDPIDVEYVKRLIALTSSHGNLRPPDVSEEEALFLDCDMAILGADEAAFDDYDRAIRAEYAAVPKELFDAGRRAFVERLLASDAIFLSPHFSRLLEAPARRNLRRLLERYPE